MIASLRWVLMVALLVVASAVSPRSAAAADGYTADDVAIAIEQYSAEFEISEAWLYRIVRCEDPTFDPYAVGRQGELGPAQLHPRGELRRFYAYGYSDPFDPYHAIRFLAQRLAMGGARAWSCA